MEKEPETRDEIVRHQGNTTSYPMEVKKLCVDMYIQGMKRDDIEQTIWDMGYTPPTHNTIRNWYYKWGEGKKKIIKSPFTEKGGRKLVQFKASKRVVEFLATIEGNKTDVLNTIIEWYLRELDKQNKRNKLKQKKNDTGKQDGGSENLPE